MSSRLLLASPSAYGFISDPDSLYGMVPHEFMKVRGYTEMCIAQCPVAMRHIPMESTAQEFCDLVNGVGHYTEILGNIIGFH